MDQNFFDPSKMSDDELDEKISKLMSRAQYVRYGMNNGALADQIESMIDSLYFEKTDRTKKISFKMTKSPVVFESEPDLRNSEKNQEVEPLGNKKGKADSQFVNRPVIIKSKPKNA